VRAAISKAAAGDITRDQEQTNIIAIRQQIAEMEIGIRLDGRAIQGSASIISPPRYARIS
jgi:hypothetical protein